MSYAVITGASKGIGKCIAAKLASMGYDVLLIARSEKELMAVCDELENSHQIIASYLPIDLSLPGSARQIFEWCMQKQLPVSILVNNAGYGLGGNVDRYTPEEQLAMMQVNMNVPVELSMLFLNQLKKSPSAYILNIASTAAYQTVPGLSIYAASKSFLLSFSRGLRKELKGSSVSVTCICPGSTDTNFVNRANLGKKASDMAAKLNMSAETVAGISIKAMFSRKAEIIPGVLNKFGALLVWLLPKNIIENTAMKIYQP